MSRGQLRIYLGAAPGVGKTHAMVTEGLRRASRGTDVVVGVVDARGRDPVESLVASLERCPLLPGGAVDVDAVVARRPQVVLVDDLATRNPTGSSRAARWQDVEQLRDHGIDVVATMNVQHVQSLADVVEGITGRSEPDTVPDEVLLAAEQIELVDMTPEALRRRVAHGNVYPAADVDAALASYFGVETLANLRELALVWLADRVEDRLRRDEALFAETRERIVVALTGAPWGDRLVRRAARLAGRLHGDLIGVHVARPGVSSAGDGLAAQRRLLEELGGVYREVVGDDVASALASFATAERATQVVIGDGVRRAAGRRSRATVGEQLVQRLHGVDVHVVASSETASTGAVPPRRRSLSAISPRRERLAWIVALGAIPLLTFALVQMQRHLDLSSALLLQLAVVVLVAAIGGLRPGVFASLAAFVLTNFFLTPPVHTLSIGNTDDLVALAVFVAVSLAVSLLVDRAARRANDAERARAEAAALARTTGSLISDSDPMPRLVEQLRVLFGLDRVSVLTRAGAGWAVTACTSDTPPDAPAAGTSLALDERGDAQLVLEGGPVGEDDVAVLRAFADQVALGLEAQRLREASAEVASLAQANLLRTALLQAVSHDLRTPLASIKASVTGLMAGDVGFTEADRESLLDTIDESADRLDRVIGNLLDMSRLQAGAAQPVLVATPLEEVVAAALHALGTPARSVEVDVSESLPMVATDAALLERAVANLVSNALAWSPAGVPVRIDAAEVRGRIDLRVVDRGPGIPVASRAAVFEPFQRLGDRSHDAGAGLGLAIAKGFVEVTGASIDVDDTPGGGATFTIHLPIAGRPT